MRIVGDRTCASVVEPGGLEFVRSEISVAEDGKEAGFTCSGGLTGWYDISESELLL